jgi:hypothetical protein
VVYRFGYFFDVDRLYVARDVTKKKFLLEINESLNDIQDEMVEIFHEVVVDRLKHKKE